LSSLDWVASILGQLPAAQVFIMAPRFNAFAIEFVYYPRAALGVVAATTNRLLKIRQLLVSTRIYGIRLDV